MLRQCVPSDKGNQNTLWGFHFVVIFCRAFLTCSTSHWVDTAAAVQPSWQPELAKEIKTTS